MIRRNKKVQSTLRSPHLTREKQTTFRYSSNRSQSEHTERERPNQTEKRAFPRLRLAALRLAHWTAIFVVLFIILLISSIYRPPKIIIASDQHIRTQQEYDQKASQIISGGLLGRSKFTVDRTKIASDIQQQFPELKEVEVSTPMLSPSIKINATVSPPAALLQSNGKNYLIDDSGTAIMSVQASSEQFQNLTLIQDQTNAPIKIGKPALTSVQTVFISELKRQAENKHLVAEELMLVAGGGELDIRYRNTSYIVKYNLYEDARKSFGSYFATRDYLERTKNMPKEYIDVRVAERAYVK